MRSLSNGDRKGCIHHLVNMMNDETSIYDGYDDPLTNAMRKYPEVPDWWFASIVLVSLAFAIITVTVWPEQDTPVWTIFFGKPISGLGRTMRDSDTDVGSQSSG